ncbi:hypothetical protein ACA910_012041 [Epithemia clementina (nom. ined.)]
MSSRGNTTGSNSSDLQVEFQSIRVANQAGIVHALQGNIVVLSGKKIYLDDSRRSLKASEILEVDTVFLDHHPPSNNNRSNSNSNDGGDDSTTAIPQRIIIRTSKPGNHTVECVQPVVSSRSKEKVWNKWIKKMQSFAVKNQETREQEQQEEEEKEDGRRKSSVRKTSTLDHRRRGLGAGRRKAFGTTTTTTTKSRVMKTALSWDDDDDNNNNNNDPRTKSKRDAPTWSRPPTDSDDEGEDGDKPNVDLRNNKGELELESSRRRGDTGTAFGEKKTASNAVVEDSDDATQEEWEDDDSVGVGAVVRRPKSLSQQKLPRRRVLDDDDDDNGDDIDKEEDGASMTTPSLSTQRLVSPTRTASAIRSSPNKANRRSKTPTNPKANADDADADDVVDNADKDDNNDRSTLTATVTAEDAHQTKISGFFAPRKRTPRPTPTTLQPRRSFDPAQNHARGWSPKTPLSTAATTQPTHTPVRPKTEPTKLRATSTAAPKNKRSVFGPDNALWLSQGTTTDTTTTTTPGVASSSPAKRKQRFFGSASWRATSSAAAPRTTLEDEDPIQDDENDFGTLNYDTNNNTTNNDEGHQTPPATTHPLHLLSDHHPHPSLPHLSLSSPKKRQRLYHDTRKTMVLGNRSSPLHRPPLRTSLGLLGTTLVPPPRFAAVEDESLVGPRHCHHRGLRNLGNTCYLNASVQMLALWCRDRLAAFFKDHSLLTSETTTMTSRLPLTQSLVQVAQGLLAEWPPKQPLPPCHQAPSISLATTLASPLVLNPSRLKRAMDDKTDKFVGYEQRDAHEFLSDLLDHIHGELEQPQQAAAAAAPRKDKVPLQLPTDDFRLTVLVSLQCTHCHYTRTKEEMYRHLSIDLPSSNNSNSLAAAQIPSSLNDFFQPEVREIRCEQCAQGTHVRQTMQIVSKPKRLLLHLKRFVFVEKPRSPLPPYHTTTEGDENANPNSPSWRNAHAPAVDYVFQKNKVPVDIQPSLTLSPYFYAPEDSTKDATTRFDEAAVDQGDDDEYELESIVHHIGRSPSSGHYTADALRPRLDDGDNTEKGKKEPSSEKVAESEAASDPKSSAPASDQAKEANVEEGTTATAAAKQPGSNDEDKEDDEEKGALQWTAFDDGNSGRTSLAKIRSNKFKQQTAYMLLYKLKEPIGDDKQQ